jgi:hypothetical protein
MKWKGKIDFDSRPEYDGNPLLSEDSGEFNGAAEKTTVSGTDLVLIEDSGDGYSKKKVQLDNLGVGGGGGIFGSEYGDAESASESETTSTSFTEKLSHTTGTLPNGRYRIGYSCELSQASSGNLALVEVKVGATIIAEASMESDSDYHSVGGFAYMDLSGAQTLVINYRTNNATNAAKVRRARLEIWRVS